LLEVEARWLGERLRSADRYAPVLNIGSSSEEFRTRAQPWIDQELFRPLRQRAVPVVHQDLSPEPGVDVVGDLHDPQVRSKLGSMGARFVVCSNVLEHVPDPGHFARLLVHLLPQGGRLLVTVPRAFPYHPDPIDTMFRPAPDELAALFPGSRTLAGEIVRGGRLHNLVLDNPTHALRRAQAFAADSLLGRKPREAAAKPAGTPDTKVRDWLFPWAYRRFEVTCLDLEL
jgi:hypothetical protein